MPQNHYISLWLDIHDCFRQIAWLPQWLLFSLPSPKAVLLPSHFPGVAPSKVKVLIVLFSVIASQSSAKINFPIVIHVCISLPLKTRAFVTCETAKVMRQHKGIQGLRLRTWTITAFHLEVCVLAWGHTLREAALEIRQLLNLYLFPKPNFFLLIYKFMYSIFGNISSNFITTEIHFLPGLSLHFHQNFNEFQKWGGRGGGVLVSELVEMSAKTKF